jgi:heme/copper-type cytochrome/quinol oxidase subunit 2
MIAATLVAVLLLVVALTAYAWWDYRHRPRHYLRGAPRRDGQDRGVTRQPIRHWTARRIRR